MAVQLNRRGRRFGIALSIAFAGFACACTEHDELLGTIAIPAEVGAADAGGSGALAVDAGASGALPVDAGAVDAATVVLTPPRFEPPVLVSALSDVNSIDEDPTFTGDLLELYFMSTRAGTKDVWTARRATETDPWGAPSRVAELSSASDDWSPGISLDGLTIWFATDRASGVGKIWQASRAARGDAWSAPAAVPELSGSDVDFAPAVDATETLLFFSSNRTGSAGFDLYASSRASAVVSWGAPFLIPGLNSASDEYDPFVAQGGLVVFFTSMRSGAGDIYWSVRRSVEEAFEAPTRLSDLDSDSYDSDSSLSPDLSYMMFSSTRSGNAEIYETHSLK